MFLDSDDLILELHNLFCLNFGGGNSDPLRKNNKETRYGCPNPECATNDPSSKAFKKQKLSISWAKNYFNCWICNFKGHSVKKLLPYLKTEQSKEQFIKLISQLYKNAPQTQQKEFKAKVNLQTFFETNQFFPLIITKTKREKEILNYVLGRGLTLKHVLFYDLKGCLEGKLKNRIIIPSYDDKKRLNYYVARNIQKNTKYPFKNPENEEIPKNSIIFNEYLIDWQKPLILVEGAFDYLKIHSLNRTCLLGSSLTKWDLLFKKIILHKTPIILFLDPDAKSKAQEIQEILISWGVTVSDQSYKLKELELKDPGQIDLQNKEHLQMLQTLKI